MAYWLLKSEPGTYSWADLVRDGGTDWDGVRNNAARLHLRAMQTGDEALFYHSGADRAVVGIARIAGPPGPDGPEWVKVRVEPLCPLPRPVTLAEIKADPGLAAMELIRQSRLSVLPVRGRNGRGSWRWLGLRAAANVRNVRGATGPIAEDWEDWR